MTDTTTEANDKRGAVMRCEIDVELGELAGEWEPVAFRVPTESDDWINPSGKIIGGIDGYGSQWPRLIVRRKWTPPAWLKPGWIAMAATGEWWWHADEPQIVDGGWCNEVACVHLLQDAFDFTPPPCDDWKQSKRRIN